MRVNNSNYCEAVATIEVCRYLGLVSIPMDGQYKQEAYPSYGSILSVHHIEHQSSWGHFRLVWM